jgi:hypothetical protein
MADNEFYLYWTINRLYGWEKTKSEQAIDAIVRGIDAGDDFPPVPVLQDTMNPFKFYLFDIESFDKYLEGGHTRALGHYIVNKPLKCVLMYPEIHAQSQVKVNKNYIEIPDIILVNDIYSYYFRKQRFPNYR